MKEAKKREVDLLILSDIHLGTRGCRAKELLKYLKSIEPARVILNGDIIDMWQFSKRYWPKSHMKVISQFFKWMSKGIKVTYITGNHDEFLRKLEGLQLGGLDFRNKLAIDIGDKRAWVFHGDIFDVTMQYSRWLTKLGSVGYNLLILTNRLVNSISAFFGKGKLSLSKKVKISVKSAVKYITRFEETAANIAAENGFHFVICGHIHQAEMRTFYTSKGEVLYLNSGDWIENLTSLESHKGEWHIYQYEEKDYQEESSGEKLESDDLEFLAAQTPKELFGIMLKEISMQPA